MFFRRLVLFLTVAISLVCVQPALAIGGHYDVVGGTPRNEVQVRKALNASRFDWSLVPERITIHITRGEESASTPGHIWLSPELLASGSFAWGIVQHEYAHQVDFFLLDDTLRGFLVKQLHAADWCYGVSGLPHASYGCERFASTLSWAYWPDARNAQRPTSPSDESAAMKPARFRTLMSRLLDFPNPFAVRLQRRP